MSRLVQERSTLLSLQSDLGRQEIAARQSPRAHSRRTSSPCAWPRPRGRMTRAEELFEQGLLNKVDHESAKDDLAIAPLELENAQQTAQLERETLELRGQEPAARRSRASSRSSPRWSARCGGLAMAAPFDGMVATVNVQDRDAVAQNQPLLTVVNLSAFEVEFDIAENYASDLVAGHAGRDPLRGQDLPRPGDRGLAGDPRQPGAGHGRVRRRDAARACARASGSSVRMRAGAQDERAEGAARARSWRAGGGRSLRGGGRRGHEARDRRSAP